MDGNAVCRVYRPHLGAHIFEMLIPTWNGEAHLSVYFVTHTQSLFLLQFLRRQSAIASFDEVVFSLFFFFFSFFGGWHNFDGFEGEWQREKRTNRVTNGSFRV